MSSIKDNLPLDMLNALKNLKEGFQNSDSEKENEKSIKRKAPLPPVLVRNIYKIEADEQNGITPPLGYKTWFKHFVVMGISDDGSLMGCVVFDSCINREHVEPGYEDYFIPISQGKYPFIDHDSYLECLKLKPATLSNIRQGKAEGRLSEEDFQKALALVKRSNRNSFITLKTYNII